ncbi:protein with role in RNA processing [Rhizoclosmatium sp. JEL0117]|nr:protein with role in RNA processing [Rhizoclosmatium sp. JEL0117]
MTSATTGPPPPTTTTTSSSTSSNAHTLQSNANAASLIGTKVKVVLVDGSEFAGLVFAYERVLGLLVLQSISSVKEKGTRADDFHFLKIASIKSAINLDKPKEPSPIAQTPAPVPVPAQSQPAPQKPVSAWSKGGPTAAQIVAGTSKTSPTSADPPHQTTTPTSATTAALPALPTSLLKVPTAPQFNVNKILAKERAAIAKERDNVKKIGVNVSKRAQDIFNALDKTLPTKWKGDAIIVLDEVMIMAPYGVDEVRGITATAGQAVERVQRVLGSLLARIE